MRDVVGVRAIVIGADLVLTITDDQRMTLATLTPEGTRQLGTFDSVGAAWAAVDAYDLGIIPDDLGSTPDVRAELVSGKDTSPESLRKAA
jgi:hypothetical protein